MMYKQRPISEPIAVIGSGCRFAGGATSPSKLWDVLAHPADLSREVPSNRFSTEAFYHPDGEYHGTTNSVKAYWLEQDHRVFDASFFNITPKEAEAIDPQQRLLLEVVYEAMESAGYTLSQCSGKDVAVFAGVMTADYDTLSQRDELSTSQYYATGNARSIISNRISYFFNFHGPSMTIDTACSSSLVALHQAVLSLRSGESTMACVTGVNLMIAPEQFIVESNLHMLSPTGKSRMWDANADGYARGEGVAALFLKPLSQALADGDDIEGIIRETGVNSDGRTKGITMPNPEAQSLLIRNTYRKTGLDLQDPTNRCQYFEAHGTGTQAGDPREAAAIHNTFFGPLVADKNVVVDASQKMLVGSVKTVIGHTEGAAGLAGVLKVLQAMKHGYVPPNLHLESLNPSVRPFCTHLEIPTTLVPWPETPSGQPRRASVNSFGFGGTNAHAIVEAYDPCIHDGIGRYFPHFSSHNTRIQRSNLHPNPHSGISFFLPICLSANSQKSLRHVVISLRDYLLTRPHISINQLAWNLFSRRSAHPHRISLSATSGSHALELMDDVLTKTSGSSDIGIRSKSMDGETQILGIFTGQGAQWASMSRSLLLSNKVYRQTIQRLDEALRVCHDPPSWTLEQQILAEVDVSRIHEATISQPLCTALQIGLVDVLRSIKVNFHTVIGHSSGEIAAAYAAGRLTARDAILISYYRGLYAHLAGGPQGEKGGMLAAGMSESEALGFCRDPIFDGKICVAAANAPSSVTLSGDLETLHLAKERLDRQNKFARMLLVDVAYHSDQMLRPAVEYVKALRRCKISPISKGNGTIWVSTCYGLGRNGAKDFSVSYWKENMVYSVQFHDAVEEAILEHGPFDCVVEVGPHSALKGPVAQTTKSIIGTAIPYSAVLDRTKDDSLAFSDFLGFIWSHMGPLAVQLCNYIEQSPDPCLLDRRLKYMPSYPWDHSQIHYRESRISRQYHFKNAAPHELLGVRTRDDNDFELRWRNILRCEKIPWLEHHSFQGQALVPASAYCIMALDAARALLNGRPASIVEISDLNIMNGISIEPDSPGVETLFSLTVVSQQTQNKSLPNVIEARFNLTSCPADGSITMRKNMEGALRIIPGEPLVDALPTREPCLTETLPASPEAFYRMMDHTGLVYSGPFRSLHSIERRLNYSSTQLKRRHSEDSSGLFVSPATLDSCLQSAFLAYASPGDRSLWTSFLPIYIERLRFNLANCDRKSGPMNDDLLTVDTHLTNVLPTTAECKAIMTTDLAIFNEMGEMEIQIDGLAVSTISKTRHEDDYELHLQTVMDVDPTDEIVGTSIENIMEFDPVLVESCERVAAFFKPSLPKQTSFRNRILARDTSNTRVNRTDAWSMDTHDTIEKFIHDSPHHMTLDLVRSFGKILPDILPATVPLIFEEAHYQLKFNQHIGRIVKQIAHRYPRMNVLSLTDPDLGVGPHILSGLEDSFISYTMGFGSDSRLKLHTQESLRDKVHSTTFNLEEDITAQQASPRMRNDLVILSTSLLTTGNAAKILKNVKGSMKDDGLLVLIHISRTSIKDRLQRVSSFATRADPCQLATPPEWPDALEACGFLRVAKNSDQDYSPGFSIIVRQASSSSYELQAQLTGRSTDGILPDRLVIIGGVNQENDHSLNQSLRERLAWRCGSIASFDGFDTLDSQALSSCTAAIIAADLDEPIMSNMTETRLSQFKELFRPNMTILWLTKNARFDNPDHAATFGFTRTIAAEIPNLRLQVLDLESYDGADEFVYEAFMRLNKPGPQNSEATPWAREPEIHMENGRRMIPRVLPWRSANNRVNTVRRVLSVPINTLRECVQISPSQNRDGSVRYEARTTDLCIQQDPQPGYLLLQVNYSSVEAIELTPNVSAYICTGRNTATGEPVVAFSQQNASFVEVPASHSYAIRDGHVSELHFFEILIRYLAALMLSKQTAGQELVLIDPGTLFMECVEDINTKRERRIRTYTTSSNKDSSCLERRIHPYVSSQQLRAMLPTCGFVYDFLPQGSGLSERIVNLLPPGCEYHTRYSLMGSSHSDEDNKFSIIESVWCTAVSAALQKASAKPRGTEDYRLVTVPSLLSGSGVGPLFEILDWRTERNVSQIVKPLIGTQLLGPSKTYVLVGLTRDFGQSLCHLFVEQGARNIVLASRNPNVSPKWKDELTFAYGANIRIEKLDVTSLEDVKKFKGRMSETMPPVGGVVNGAMVLEDRVFSQMTLDNWNSVLRPKTVGSKNLDVAFSDSSLEFFIMTSSFAAIGGHPGQSNYAAANMYMNGLAANRRRRGLAGSVLNIGVIYGLGLLQREKEELYVGLEREGYPPISERDIHHMFLEAIMAGKPGATEQPYDITTGLSRFKWDSEHPLHWHLDPRFSHYTVKGDAYDAPGEVEAQKSLKDRVVDLKSSEQMAEVIMVPFFQRLETLLQLPEGGVNRHNSMSELGIDSLIAVEIRNWIWKTLGRDLAVLKILGASSIYRLCLDMSEQILADVVELESTSNMDTPVTSVAPSEVGASVSNEMAASSTTDESSDISVRSRRKPEEIILDICDVEL